MKPPLLSPELEAFFAGMVAGIFVKTRQVGQDLPALDPIMDDALRSLMKRVMERFESMQVG